MIMRVVLDDTNKNNLDEGPINMVPVELIQEKSLGLTKLKMYIKSQILKL